MVLSNKKLKQNLRAELLAKRVSEPEPDEKTHFRIRAPVLKSLLDSVTLKPRLSKRERRRKRVFSKRLNQEPEENGMEIEEDEEQRTSEEVYLTKVYVGGIPYRYSEDDIRYYFESCGTITDIDCMKFPDTGKFRGIAIVSFETEAAAKEALALDRAEMGGMQLTIQPYKSTRVNKATGFAPKMVEGYNRIYLGNLSWDITEDDLKKFFSDGNVSSIRFGMNKETGEFRGYAHVDFSDSVSVAMALKLDQEIVCGRPVKISCAVPKKAVQTQSGSHQTRNEVCRSDERASSKEVSMSVREPVGVSVEAPQVSEVDNGGLSVSSGKLRRRTCYQCGEKGHISSACTKGPAGVEAPTGKEVPLSVEAPTGNEAPLRVEALTVNEVDNVGLSVSSGKLRRRTCYVCGQKGHISSACPKGPVGTEAPTSNETTLSVEAPTTNEPPPVNEVENAVLSVSSAMAANTRGKSELAMEKRYQETSPKRNIVWVERKSNNEQSSRGLLLVSQWPTRTSSFPGSPSFFSRKTFSEVMAWPTGFPGLQKGSSETYGSSKDSNDVAQTRRKHHSWSEFKELEEDDHRIFMAKTNRELISEGNSVSTQTDGVKQGRFGVEIAEEHEMEPNDLHDSRPSSNSNSEILKGLNISADIRDQSVEDDRPSGRIKASAVLMQLIACGSRRVKDWESMEIRG
ncbi:F-box protein [Hibiscus syriacus]|uniref:F-box protein n=1 Tax=Hibiscus syriacus TaxID=106335 RepID=A0A6A2X2W5_HIBSY|nr:F-box protein [Hibiscus syriacus]